jgi:hypothetical protein
MVVRAHHEEAVLDGDRDDERPQDQREDAEGGLWGKLSTDGLDDRLQGVERARPEVAIDDAERGECCCRRRSPSDAGRRGAFFSGSDNLHRICPFPGIGRRRLGSRPVLTQRPAGRISQRSPTVNMLIARVVPGRAAVARMPKDQTGSAISISVRRASAILHSQHAKLGVLAPTGILTLAARLEEPIRSPIEQLSHAHISLSDLFLFSVWSALCR